MMFETEGSRKSPGDHVEQTAEEGSTPSRSHERQLVTRFDARTQGSDFAGVAAPGGKFKAICAAPTSRTPIYRQLIHGQRCGRRQLR